MNLTSAIAVLAVFATALPLAAEFRVGFASADITPPVGWRRAGNFTELISTGVHDPLLTKAMVVQDGATTIAFVGNDRCSVPRDLTDLARIRANQLTGIPVANIVITATHTHGGPEYLRPWRQFLDQRALKANPHPGAKPGKLSDEASAELAKNANYEVRAVAPLSLRKNAK